jgi:hypothetical protein
VRFGLYVHQAGSTWFDDLARTLGRASSMALADAELDEIDGLYISFFAVSHLNEGVRKLKKKVRRDYTMKIITGGSQHFRCLIELDVEVADSELVAAAGSESSLFSFVKSVVLRCLPMALGNDSVALAVVQAAVSSARLPYEPRW